MIYSDYIMRMVTMLATFLARVLVQKNIKAYPLALTEIDQAGRTLVGMDRAMMRLFSAEQLMELFGKDQTVALPKAYVLGVLMTEDAEILAAQENTGEAPSVRSKALHLLLTTFLENEGPIDDQHQERIDRCVRACRDDVLPPTVLKLLIRQLEMTGRLAQAEDRLHELLESAPGSIEFGRGFYDRLLARPDRELEAGGLNREEAVQGRAELERHGHV